MREHVRLGHIAGIRVGINWSVLAIFLLITFGLAAGRFPLLHPGYSTAVYAIAGLAAGLVFFLSLLAHEISHAMVARRNGVEVEGITLWLFGGVASLQGEAADPGAELRISGVGPLTSVALAAAFGVFAALLSVGGAADITVGVFIWLAAINLVLAVFNLVPAAPLDGGRILRAFLWKRRGDRTSAAITAARAGRGFGWLLVLLGVAEVLFFVGFGGIWLMLIGWFLTSAAAAEEQQARISDTLDDVLVRDVMSPHPTAAPADISVAELLEEYVFNNRYSTFPLVHENGEPVGLVTLARVKQTPVEQRDTTAVTDIACGIADVPTVSPETPVTQLLPRMAGCSDGRALVVDQGRLVGIVSPTDVIRQLEIAELRRSDDRESVGV